jgi:hypothetical protein
MEISDLVSALLTSFLSDPIPFYSLIPFGMVTFALCLSHQWILEVCKFLLEFYRCSAKFLQLSLPCETEESLDLGVLKQLRFYISWRWTKYAFHYEMCVNFWRPGTECSKVVLPKAYVLKGWSLRWHYWELVELLRGDT